MPLNSSPSAGTAISAGVKMDQAEFYAANQVDGQLTDSQSMQMLALALQGDSGTAEQQTQQTQSSETPGAAIESETTKTTGEVVQGTPEPTPVVLAKDGVHTIPYGELEEARKAAQFYKQQLAEQQQLIDQQRRAQIEEAQATVKPTLTDTNQGSSWISQEEMAKAFGDFSEEGIAKGVASLVDKRTQAMLTEVEARAEAKAAERVRAELQARDLDAQQQAHFDAVYQKHPDAESIAQSVELREWIKTQPSYAQAGIVHALQQGTAAEVIEALDAFKAATTSQKPAAVPSQQPVAKQDVTVAAKAVIAQAKSQPPMSLSAMPAGSSAAVDEAAAMREMSGMDLINRFGNMTPEQIREKVDRALY